MKLMSFITGRTTNLQLALENLHSKMQGLNLTAVDNFFLRITAVVSAAKPGTVVNTVEDLAKFPRCDMETWILSALQYSLGFDFSLTTTRSYGELNSTTQLWDGMIGSLRNITADLAISTSAILPLKYKIVDYTMPLGSTPGFVAFYLRQSFAYDSWALSRPFHAEIWLLISVLLAITSILFACILLSKRLHDDCKGTSLASALYLGCLWSIATVSLKPGCSLKSNMSSTILFLTFSLGAFILNAFYNGKLLSFLSVPSEPFKRFDQLLAVPFEFVLDYHLQFMAGDLETISTTKGFEKAVKKPLEAPRGLIGAKTDVLKGSYAFICIGYRGYIDLRDSFTPVEQASISELRILNGQPRKHALMLPQVSPHKRLINSVLLKAMQCGVNKLWNTRLLTRRPDSREAVSLLHPPISIMNMVIAAVVFICGFIAAATIFLCEFLYVKNKTYFGLC